MNICLIIRKKYSLTRKSLSTITGISVNSLQRYELQGNQPNQSQKRLLKSCLNPYTFRHLFDVSKENLNKTQLNIIFKRIDNIIVDIEKNTQKYKESLIDNHIHIEQ